MCKLPTEIGNKYSCTYMHIKFCSAFMQMLNGITSGGFNAKAKQVSVPFGLKSTGYDVQLRLTVRNSRDEAVNVWWVDYSGNPVL